MSTDEYNNSQEMQLPAELRRELGKKLYIGLESDAEQRNKGIRFLLSAAKDGDNEARYIIGLLLVDGHLKFNNVNSREKGLTFLCLAANNGFLPARIRLNKYCEDSYNEAMKQENYTPERNCPLTDFDGKQIRINRTGVLSPIDAKLEFIDGKNILSLSTNILFFENDENNVDLSILYKAVLDGINEWAGEYEVFGGQILKVVINITTETRIFDNLLVVPVTKDFKQMITEISDVIGTKSSRKSTDIINNDRSMAVIGVKRWSVTSRKYIYMKSKNGKFDDYEELKSVAKHEFGHALGLGDLYYSPQDDLYGVEKGSFREIDNYWISEKFYNLVMCDHHGPISNNDIEMVVLAFSENRGQDYQKSKISKRISTALGRGN